MKKSILPPAPNPHVTADWGIEELDCKDVYFPDEPDLESLKLAEAKQAFQALGYRVLSAIHPR